MHFPSKAMFGVNLLNGMSGSSNIMKEGEKRKCKNMTKKQEKH
jgi:hypothetical protein